MAYIIERIALRSSLRGAPVEHQMFHKGVLVFAKLLMRMTVSVGLLRVRAARQGCVSVTDRMLASFGIPMLFICASALGIAVRGWYRVFRGGGERLTGTGHRLPA